MAFPQAQLDKLQQIGFLDSPWRWVLMLACLLPFLAFVAYTK